MLYSGTLLRTKAQETQIALSNKFQRGKGGIRIYGSFCWDGGGGNESNVKRLLLITKTRHLKLMILVMLKLRFSTYGKMQESRLTEIIP